MPRQNFISRDFFVPATEMQAEDTVRAIPHFVPCLKLVDEKKVSRSLCFLSERQHKKEPLFIEVRILCLDHEFTNISLRLSYVQGGGIVPDEFLTGLLRNFEEAVDVSLKGDVSLFRPLEEKQSLPQRLRYFVLHPFSFMTLLFLRKKLS